MPHESLRPLARFYFFAYAVVGITLPYLPQHFRGLGLSGSEVGLLVGIGPLGTLLVPPLWGYLADRTRRSGALLAAATGGSALAIVPLLWARTPAAIAPWLALQAIFGSPVAMLADSVALEHVRGAGGQYSRVRLFGSLGFVCAALGFSLLWQPGRGGPPMVIAAAVVFWALAFLSSLKVRASSRVASQPANVPLSLADALSLLADGRVRLLLLATCLHWMAMSPYHLLFTLHLHDLGLPPAVAGLAQVAAVAAEIGVMFLYRRLSARHGAPRLLLAAFLASSARWLLVGLSQSALPLLALQLLHGLSFGAFMVSAVSYLSAVVPTRLRATGQALYVCATYGLGGLVGAVGAGRLYDLFPARALFFAAAALELVPALLSLALPTESARRAGEVEVGSEAVP